MKVTLYSTHCPRCIVLSKKLAEKGIEYEEVTDVNLMQEKGIKTVPMLGLDDELLDFGKAVSWINNN